MNEKNQIDIFSDGITDYLMEWIARQNKEWDSDVIEDFAVVIFKIAARRLEKGKKLTNK